MCVPSIHRLFRLEVIDPLEIERMLFATRFFNILLVKMCASRILFSLWSPCFSQQGWLYARMRNFRETEPAAEKHNEI